MFVSRQVADDWSDIDRCRRPGLAVLPLTVETPRALDGSDEGSAGGHMGGASLAWGLHGGLDKACRAHPREEASTAA